MATEALSSTGSGAVAAPVRIATVAVRVEDDTSIGRSYSKRAEVVKGIGAARRALTSTTWHDAYPLADRTVTESLTLGSMHLSKCSRDDVMAYFRNTWDLTTTLFSALANDSAFYAFPDKLRRPLIFYSAHPAALYVNKMHQAGLLDHVNPYFAKLFETGVDEMSWDDMDVMQDEDFAWPTVAEVVEFRAAVFAAVERVIRAMPHPRDVPITQSSPYWSLVMGFEHERIHLETSSVLMHQLPINLVRPPPGWRTAPTFAPAPADAPTNTLVSVPAGVAVLGKPRDYPSFGWDNEYGHREVAVPAFQASQFTVTNGEFLPFVLAGGYRDRKWWVGADGDDEGWRWRTYRNATHPSFWVATSHPDMVAFHGGRPDYPYQKDDGHERAGTGNQFMLRTVFDIIAMPWDWPVEVNYLEAAAFLRWKAAQEGGGATYRMPTEAEYHLIRGDPVPFPNATSGAANTAGVAGGVQLAPIASSAAPVGGEVVLVTAQGKVAVAGGGEEPAVRDPTTLDPDARFDVIMQPTAPGNLNWRWHSSSPVNMYAPSSTGFYDAHGNVYQWVEDHFAPLPGFEIHYMYDDFSAPCFDGWHTVIMGGSWVSTGDQASSFARYHFRRHFFQHLGFRYVRVTAPEPYPGAATVTNLWEGAGTVSRDITNAYGKPGDRMPYPAELVAPDNALAYAMNVAQLAARAYVTYSAPASAATSACGGLSAAKVLHLGCGVGGGTLELAKAGFGLVVGVDDSEPSIRHARVLQHHGQFEYERVREGVLTDRALVKVAATTADRARVSYFNADPRVVPADILALGPFDVLVVDGLLTKQTQPLELLSALSGYVRPGGLTLVATSNDWDPRVTPRNSWLGGFKMNGEDMSTLHMLKYHLKRKFEFLEAADVPKLTRASARVFSLELLETSLWRRLE